MSRVYDEIMELIGADAFKNLIKKWDTLSSNMQKNQQKLPILLPDLLWVGNSGIGRTKLVTLMSEYLYSKGNLMDFYGDVKYLEFLLSYVPPSRPFDELQRLEEEIAAARGFRSDFRGVLLFDIDPWVDHYEELYFVSFMEYLAAHSDEWLVVLSVSQHSEEKLHKLEAFLSMYLRMDRLTLTLPKTQEFLRFIQNNLQVYGLSLDDSAQELLTQTLNDLRKNPYFDGFKTIKMLYQDIIYEHFSKPDAVPRMLTASDLGDFAPGSNYVKTIIQNAEKKRHIGYARWED